jgi:short-subunit dehydrogenase
MARDGRRKFAIVTGASTGIGLELVKCCAPDGYDLLIVADEPRIADAADQIRAFGTVVDGILSRTECTCCSNAVTRRGVF